MGTVSNMSYYRFRNTLSDLRDCELVLEEGEELIDEEKGALKEMFKVCQRLLNIKQELEDYELGQALQEEEL